MANPWQYSRARRIATQVVMWLVLGLTVTLALVVSSYRRSAMQLTLLPQAANRGVTISLPRRWDIARGRDELAPTLFSADETDAEGRNFTVILHPLPMHATPVEVALRGSDRRTRRDVKQQPITIGNDFPGVLVTYQERIDLRSIGDAESMEAPAKFVSAATVLPSGRALSINLVGYGEVESADVELVRKIASSVSVASEPSLRRVSSIDLPDDVRVTRLPDGFELVEPTDPQSTDRVLRYRDGSNWRNIRLCPAIYLKQDRPASIQTVLSCIDPAWAEAIVKETSPGNWRMDRDDVASSPATTMPTRAYLLADPSGAALLAIFSGGADDAWIEPAWQQIASSAKFPARDAIDAMLSAGAQEAARLRDEGLATLLPPAREDAWWLLCIDNPHNALGWLHQSPVANGGKFELRMHFPEEHSEQIVCDYTAGADLATYHAAIEYQVAPDRDRGTPQWQRYLSQTSRLKAGKLELTVKPQEGSASAVEATAPPQFVPGALLWDVLGKLSVDQPMILRTDLAIDSLNSRPTAPLTLIIRSEAKPPRDAKDGDSSPLRCISVELAGTGSMSRWYFKSDGTLESADFSQHIRQLRRDQADISLDFARTPIMKP